MYWEIIQFDGTITHIPPDAVDVVKRRLENGQHIHTKTATIPSNQVKSFRQTERQYQDTKLIEEASMAFNEAVLTEEGVVCRWVKKRVPRDRWDKYYSKIPSYRLLDGKDNMFEIAFQLPIHTVDLHKVSFCTENEINKLLK